MNSRLSSVIISVLLVCLSSCGEGERQSINQSLEYFEGQIEVIESGELIGSIFEKKITYLLSENKLKRTVRYTHNHIRQDYAGMLIDLETDSVLLYYVDAGGKGNVFSATTKAYFSLIEPQIEDPPHPSPFDKTFLKLDEYQLIRQVKDSVRIQGFQADFTQYQSHSNNFEQGIFDSKEILVKRPSLEMAFVNIQEEVNFPLGSLKKMAHIQIGGPGTNDPKEEKVDQLLEEGLNFLRKGADVVLTLSSRPNSILRRPVQAAEFALPDTVAFTAFTNIEEFWATFPERAEEDEEIREDRGDREKRGDGGSKLKTIIKIGKVLEELD